MPNIIVLDVETSGLTDDHALLSIGAVHYASGATFYGECGLRPGALVSEKALEINGFTMEQIRSNKTQATELVRRFMTWALKVDEMRPDQSLLIAGHNIGSFDVRFLKKIANDNDFGFDFEGLFGYRYLDLHSAYFQKFRESLGMAEICDRLGVPREPKPHNALKGALTEYECFKKLLN